VLPQIDWAGAAVLHRLVMLDDLGQQRFQEIWQTLRAEDAR